ncbi:effector-associated domain 2-containing protein [Amycolatopsis sp. H20-H5]|uniref:effector-associated domain 2-containing protein n=1 Tax=Amycolatopsis sp. H20-H5 TaxID=3046309 RepID=UPI002DB5FFBE|nr:hypothetical protein [Amycolatopsis sp. H20-H5]MEC3977824.1 hypothetical protein [Amycolatopsis sp. H20-H5]
MAGFTSPSRTMTHQLAVHDGLYDVLKGAFKESGLDWDACELQGTGDGVLVQLPPELPKSVLAEAFPTRLIARLHRYNAVHSAEASVQLRVALHAGEVHNTELGSVSQAVNFTFRILDAPEAKAALKQSGAALALIASDSFYHDVIAHDPAAEPGAYRRIPVVVKETSTQAWLRLSSGGSHDKNVPAADGKTESPDAFLELVEAVLAVPFVREPHGRQLLLDMMNPDVATAVPHHAQPRLHVIALVRTCLRYDDGLSGLLACVRAVDPDSGPVRRLAALVRQWPAA